MNAATNRLPSFLATAFFLTLMALLGGCGSGSSEEPRPASAPSNVALYISSPGAVVLTAGSNAVYTVGGGTPPYNVSSSNTSTATAQLAGTTLTIVGVAASATAADVVVHDAVGATANVTVTVTGGSAVGAAPTVLWTIPSDNQTNVSTSASVLAKFSTEIDPLTVSAGSVQAKNVTDGSVVTIGAITQNSADTFSINVCDQAYYVCNTALNAWTPGKDYEVTFTNSIRSTSGAQLVAKSFRFTTGGGTAPDTTAPTVVYTIPNSINPTVSTSPTITIKFSEAMDANTITNSSVTVSGGGSSPVANVNKVSDDLYTLSFLGTSTLNAGTLYTVTVTNSVRDKAGNAMGSSHTFEFKTSGGGGNTAALDVLPGNSTATVGDVLNFRISGGAPLYSAFVNNPSIASVSPIAADNSFTVTLLNVGITTVTVTDSLGQVKPVALSVTSAAATLRLSPSEFSITETNADPIQLRIFGGTAPYTVLTSDAALSSVAVNGTTLTVSTGTQGNRCITGDAAGATYKEVVFRIVDSQGASASSTMKIQDSYGADPGDCP